MAVYEPAIHPYDSDLDETEEVYYVLKDGQQFAHVATLEDAIFISEVLNMVKLPDENEYIYVIEYVDIAGRGIDAITTKEREANERWNILTTTERTNPIRLIYTEYVNGVRKSTKVADVGYTYTGI